MITIDINKAKEITKNRLRSERSSLLESLDVAFMRALEQGNDTAEILAEKQRLRDITVIVDDCTTPEQLIAIKVGEV